MERPQVTLFRYVALDDRIPVDQPLRTVRPMVETALAALSPTFDAIYQAGGRPSIPPEQLLRALLLQVLYTVRSERQLMEQLQYNLLFRWFVGLGMDDVVWDVTVFTKNRERLLAGEVAEGFFAAVLAQAKSAGLLSAEHFTVDGTLVQAWAGHKSFRRDPAKAAATGSDDGSDDGAGGGVPDAGTGTDDTETRDATTAQQRWFQGQPVKPVLFFMDHSHTPWNYNWAWRWFYESWTMPPLPPVDPNALAAALPALTPAIVDTILAFWDQGGKKPPPILEAARDQERWKEVPILVGRRVYTLIMADMVALAAGYPWVAATLQASGFTAQRWERYRAALASASATIMAMDNSVAAKDPRLVEPPVEPNSVLGKNIEIFKANSARLTVSLMGNP